MPQPQTCNRNELAALYRSLLLDGIVPFWWTRGVDCDHGGVLSSMQEDGTPISGDKYIWSQGRFAWVASALHARIESRDQFLDAARATVHFLLRHGRNEKGHWVYRTTREGRMIEGPTSIYSDCFAVYGLSEYYRITRDQQAIDVALETWHGIRARVEDPSFDAVAPYKLQHGRRPHAIPMILTEVSNELAQTTGDSSIDRAAGEYAERILNQHVRPDNILVEFRDWQYQPLPPNEGTAVMPGHGIESMWFIMHWARLHKRPDMIEKAAAIIKAQLEASWDPEHGGIYLAIDAEGHPPFLANPEKKVWWPHTEALYALLLTHHLTAEPWCMEWYQRVHEWSFAHFPMECGEWRQRLDRQGNPITELIALPVKDPFHLPRAVILILQLLRG
ncbi:MAG: AGE family epimerase/isomerase [Acidobacteria bacterium]|nr:AGE family epimerase/isomerase [Acidobacteriota bacterium]